MIINDSIVNNYAQIMANPVFEKMIKEYVEMLSKKHSSVVESISKFERNGRYQYKKIVEFLYSLTFKSLDKIVSKDEIDEFKMHEFIEGFYDFWREKHRFMIKFEKYAKGFNSRDNSLKSAEFVGDMFEKKVRDIYRSLEKNVYSKTEKVFRQVPSGIQTIFLVDKSRIRKSKKMEHEWAYSVPFVWSVIFEPPVIFYTNSNKRKGIFPIVNERVLSKVNLGKGNWYAMPLHVGDLIIYTYVSSEYLCHAAGLANLFEIATPDELKVPDGMVIFGASSKNIGKNFGENFRNGVVFKDELYTGIIPATDENDYFGYAKKIVLTVHNLVKIDKWKLPIHGSLARIKLKNGKSATAMFVGDSGAGKSETLDALGRLPNVLELEVIIDDMGSLSFENEKVVAYGTETGAFVRLDDLPPGYAYANIDRSVLINPDQNNARVIVPYGNYDVITKPTPIDFFLYANNYTNVKNDKEERVHFFDNSNKALEVFSKGARIAKGTTAEKGMSYSYFANPFGAIQRREVHEKIAKDYMEKMFETNVKVGEIRTMLGVEGYEKKGPHLAAQALLNVISNS